MQYTQAELDAFWAQYVVMKIGEIISLTNSSSAAYDAGFSAKLLYVRNNRLYGFANYGVPNALGVINNVRGDGDGFNGPTQS
jgi:hypothetical protein